MWDQAVGICCLPIFYFLQPIQISRKAGRASSNYDALQIEFQKRLSHGIQALVSYIWSHSIDDGSNNFFTDQLLRGSSDFDVRHNFQMALTYDVPGSYSNQFLAGLLKHSKVDTRVSAQTALPIDIIACLSLRCGGPILPNGDAQVLKSRTAVRSKISPPP